VENEKTKALLARYVQDWEKLLLAPTQKKLKQRYIEKIVFDRGGASLVNYRCLINFSGLQGG
jgi:hypothetical protein